LKVTTLITRVLEQYRNWVKEVLASYTRGWCLGEP